MFPTVRSCQWKLSNGCLFDVLPLPPTFPPSLICHKQPRAPPSSPDCCCLFWIVIVLHISHVTRIDLVEWRGGAMQESACQSAANAKNAAERIFFGFLVFLLFHPKSITKCFMSQTTSMQNSWAGPVGIWSASSVLVRWNRRCDQALHFGTSSSFHHFQTGAHKRTRHDFEWRQHTFSSIPLK